VSTRIAGNPHLDGIPLDSAKLNGLLAILSIGDTSPLARLDGHFAILAQHGERSFAITDREGSYPVFHCANCGKFSLRFACECPDSARELTRGEIVQYMYSGVLPGGVTWQKNVTSLGAAEIGWIEKGRLKRNTWWHPPGMTKGRRAESWDELFGHLADKIHRFGKGKTLLLPISGGVDSRLIAALVKESGHEDVLAFSYGTADSSEMAWGRQSAKILGFRWEGIEYSESTWQGLFEDEEYLNFVDRWSSGVSPPHIQDFPASQRLNEILGGLENTVLLPGFGPVEPDIQISATERGGHALTREQTLAKLIRHEMFLWNIWNPRWNGWKELKQGLREDWLADPMARKLGGHDYILHWYWKNRFSRYLMNSQRNYERFGAQWLLPFCDERWLENRLSLNRDDAWMRRGIVEAASSYLHRFGIDLPFAGSAGRIFLPDFAEGFFEKHLPWLPVHVSRKMLARSKSGAAGDWMRWSVLLSPRARKRVRFIGVPRFMSFMVLREIMDRQAEDTQMMDLLDRISEGFSGDI
jgi:asparagine synthase (glutamine-hydrolysing)